MFEQVNKPLPWESGLTLLSDWAQTLNPGQLSPPAKLEEPLGKMQPAQLHHRNRKVGCWSHKNHLLLQDCYDLSTIWIADVYKFRYIFLSSTVNLSVLPLEDSFKLIICLQKCLFYQYVKSPSLIFPKFSFVLNLTIVTKVNCMHK